MMRWRGCGGLRARRRDPLSLPSPAMRHRERGRHDYLLPAVRSPLGKLADFEAYGAMWLDLVPRFGGIHHGYFLPSEGDGDIALAMFSFPSLAACEQYRKDAETDPDVAKTIAYAKETRCFTRYERS